LAFNPIRIATGVSIPGREHHEKCLEINCSLFGVGIVRACRYSSVERAAGPSPETQYGDETGPRERAGQGRRRVVCRVSSGLRRSATYPSGRPLRLRARGEVPLARGATTSYKATTCFLRRRGFTASATRHGHREGGHSSSRRGKPLTTPSGPGDVQATQARAESAAARPFQHSRSFQGPPAGGPFESPDHRHGCPVKHF
jgi:hypothetical protein